MIPVVIPAKPLHTALQRLSGVLAADERRALQTAMLKDVLIAGTRFSGRVIVVTGDVAVAQLARCHGARVAPDADPPAGINAAVARGIAATDGQAVLVVMGDLPCATAADLQQVAAERTPGRGITIAVSGDGMGTNAMLLTPADVIRPAFGADSLRRHLIAAEQAGVEATLVTAPGLMLDVDMPADLAALATRDPSSHTRRLWASLGLEERLVAAAAG
jgi:2-phospho-L-lactate guanylyltransferase